MYATTPQGEAGTEYEAEAHRFTVETVASGLEVPWALAWMPDGRMLVTERPGRLRVVEPGGGEARLLAEIDQVDHAGEHGLMGMALSPDFARDRFIYLSYTCRHPEGGLQNVIARFRLRQNRLTDRKVLVKGLPAGDYHDGLPLRFGPDGTLWASTGDATRSRLAQRKDSLAGKFLRMNPDGSVPQGNPFGDSLAWSLGHRNCQGFAWHPSSGLLYAIEHGPSFPIDGVGGKDEINLIEKGANYGWPKLRGDEKAGGFEPPVVHSGTDTWAPAGACFYDGEAFPEWRGRFFFGGLRGAALYCVTFSEDDPRQVERMTKLLHKEFGRLRHVAQGPDGYLYITTSNRDKRGYAAAEDDRILRLVPAE